MQALLKISRAIDRLSGWIGSMLSWVAVALVALGVINVVGRYLGAQLGMQLSSNALLEAQTQAFDLMFLLGACYLLGRDGHIRIDILHGRQSPRVQAWIDIVGTVFVLIPFCVVVIWLSLDYVGAAWSRLEMSPNPGGLPLYPIKTVIPLAFALLLLQGLSELIKRIATVAGIETGPVPTRGHD
jgi:TRAP-type mannitol/chloroaromatic compound transport system permease small subunit